MQQIAIRAGHHPPALQLSADAPPRRAQKMVVIFSRAYLTRLWCTYELATFCKLMRDEPGISASEIGRRLGSTPGFGRTIVRRITGEQRGVA